MKVFISSVIQGFEEYRAAAMRACRALRHEVKRAEDFAASSASPQQACLAGVRWADVVVLLVGGRYGESQPSGLSATHEEYREARERVPVLAFVQERVEREPAQREFLREVRAWTAGHITASFTDVDELRDAVTAALRDLELSRAAGPVDEQEILARARALVPTNERPLGVRLALVVAGGPRQAVLRPKALEASELEETLTREATFGALRVFDRSLGTRPRICGDALVIEQDNASLFLDQLGSMRLVVPAEAPRPRREPSLAGVAIEEDIDTLLRRMLQFSAWTLDHVDPVRRLSDVVPVVALQGAFTWRTRAEHQHSPNSYPIRMSQEAAIVHLSPARRHRAALGQASAELAEDLTALLARRMRS
jgi:hypothetical protein